MLKDSVQAKGNLKIVVLDENKQIKETREVNNLVVTVGKAHIASRMASNTAVIMSHMGVGSANTTPSASQTTLGSELARVALDTTAASNATVTYSATFPPSVGTGTLREAGIFNADTSGTMLCRTQFNDINKDDPDTIVITWNVTIQ